MGVAQPGDRVLIIGCGYLGAKFGLALKSRGCSVTGTTRSSDKAETLKKVGIAPILCDLETAAGFAHFNEPDVVLLSPAPDRSDPDGYRRVYQTGMNNVMNYLTFHPPKKKILYTSSVGIYENDSGEGVDESEPVHPTNSRTQALAFAEQAVLKSGTPSVIARLGGIYGPERNRMENLTGDPNRIVNLIHIDDAVGGLLHLMEFGEEKEIYNLVDMQPVKRKDYFEWLAGRLGKSASFTGSPGPVTGKKCSNRKLQSLGWIPLYPTYVDGYEAIISSFPH